MQLYVYTNDCRQAGNTGIQSYIIVCLRNTSRLRGLNWSSSGSVTPYVRFVVAISTAWMDTTTVCSPACFTRATVTCSSPVDGTTPFSSGTAVSMRPLGYVLALQHS